MQIAPKQAMMRTKAASIWQGSRVRLTQWMNTAGQRPISP